MEKLRYEKPMAEVILFESEDVITTSGLQEPEYGTGEVPDELDLYYYGYYE